MIELALQLWVVNWLCSENQHQFFMAISAFRPATAGIGTLKSPVDDSHARTSPQNTSIDPWTRCFLLDV